jgi:hypothetical protein
LENRLQTAYRPVQPRAEFVRRLHGQLVTQFNSTQIETRMERRQLSLVVGASLIGVAFAFLMGMRTVITLGMVLGLLMEMKKPVDVNDTAPVRSST